MIYNGLIITLLLGVVVLSGCATMRPPTYLVQVDSIGNDSENKTYILLSSNKDTKTDDLQFKEYATYLNRALQARGFVPAKNIQEANVAIFLSYGIGDPREHQYTYSLPIWGKTGISSSTTYGTSNTYGSLNTYGNYGTYTGNTNSTSTTTYTPTYGITGSVARSGSYTTFFRFMLLNAIDLDEYKRSKKEIQLWKTTVTSSGSSSDLRRVFPILVAASKNHIATNTGKKLQIKLLEKDAQVMAIKGIVKEPEK